MFSILVLLFSFFLHLSYIPNGFTWLDHGDIEWGRVILPFAEWYRIPFIRLGETGFYRPLVTLVHNIDFILYGQNSWGFHLTNVLFHLAAIWFLPHFLSLFFDFKRKERLVAMIIFAVMPIHWLPIGAISYRQEIMYSLFTMLAIYFFAQKGTVAHFLLFGASVLLAFFSKETAVVMVPALVIFRQAKNDKLDNLTNLINVINLKNFKYILLCILLFIYFILRYIAVPEVWTVKAAQLSLVDSLGTRIVAVGRLALALVSPLLPPLSDSVYVYSIFHPLALLTLFICVCCGVFIHKRGLYSDVSKLMILFSFSLLPAFQIVPAPRFYSIHYGYFASLFVPMIFILIIRFARISFLTGSTRINLMDLTDYRLGYRSILLYVLSVLIIVWIFVAGYSTYQGGKRFKNDLTLFVPEIQRDDHYREGHQYIGDYYFFDRDERVHDPHKHTIFLAKAASHYEKALKKDPNRIVFVDEGSVLNNFAGVRLEQKRFVAAGTLLDRLMVIEGGGGSTMTRYNRALVAWHMKDYQLVVKLLWPLRNLERPAEIRILLRDALRQINERK